MRFILAPEAGADIGRLTDSQFGVEHDTGGVYLVDLKTGQKVQLMQPVPCEVDFTKVKSLSRRERQVFELLGDGRSMNEIAAHLSISVKTVETFRERIRQKLEATNGLHVLRLATEWKLLSGTNGNSEPS